MPATLETVPNEMATVDPTIEAPAVPLTALEVGDHGWLEAADLEAAEREMLLALGLVDHCRFRVRKAGDPWILQVRSTRIGLSDAVAHRLLVTPDRSLGPAR